MDMLKQAPSIHRRPAVAGYFYPADPGRLATSVDAWMRTEMPPVNSCAVIAPHGSYRHAGAIAGSAFARTRIPRRCAILGPSHTGSWMPWSLMQEGAYRTPLGEVPIARAFAEALSSRCGFLEADGWGQVGEHAIEVLLPFLQRRAPSDLAIVPLIMNGNRAEELAQLTEALVQVIRMQEEPVLLIASSDLSHYEPQARGALHDRAILERINALDGRGLLHDVQEQGLRMCGVEAVACVLEASKSLGANRVLHTGYGSSAEAGGDPNSVIGYAGVVIHKDG